MARTETSRPVVLLMGLAAILATGASDEPKTWEDDGVTISTSGPRQAARFYVCGPRPIQRS